MSRQRGPWLLSFFLLVTIVGVAALPATTVRVTGPNQGVWFQAGTTCVGAYTTVGGGGELVVWRDGRRQSRPSLSWARHTLAVVK